MVWYTSDGQMFPDIAFLTSKLGTLQKISIRVLLFLDILVGRRIWDCNELDARSSKKVLPFSDVSNLIGQCWSHLAEQWFYWLSWIDYLTRD